MSAARATSVAARGAWRSTVVTKPLRGQMAKVRLRPAPPLHAQQGLSVRKPDAKPD